MFLLCENGINEPHEIEIIIANDVEQWQEGIRRCNHEISEDLDWSLGV